MNNLAFYIYPLPYGTNYTTNDLSVQDKVIELFNYCNRKSDSIWVQIESLLAEKMGFPSRASRKIVHWTIFSPIGEHAN